MSARRPVLIDPCPIIDATAELRFESSLPAAIALGLGYKALVESFPTVAPLQTIPLPDELRKANPALLYQAQYRFESEYFVALLGPNMFAVGVNGAYTRWPVISKSFAAALERIKGAGIIGLPQRFGLKYTNFFPGNVLPMLNVELGIAGAETGKTTMTTTRLSLPAEVPETYEDLVRLYPPRKIHDQIELENATEVADWIALRAKNDAQLDYLELLGDLLDEYENRSPKPEKASSPREMLNYLVQENDISTRELGKILGVDHSVAARILKAERAITIEHAKSLGARFKVDPKVFLEL